MTRLEIANNVASNLGDASFIQFSQDSINESIQDAYNLIVCKTLCLQASFNFPQIPDQVYYRFPAYYPDILAISAIFNYNTNRWLLPVDKRQFAQMRWDWELMNGEPQWFDPQNFYFTAIVPHNSTAVSKGFCVFYRQQADILVDSKIPSIPPQAIQAIENWATKAQFESIREFTKAQTYKQLFYNAIPEIKKLTSQLAFADKMNVLAPNEGLGNYAYTGVSDEMWVGNETPTGTQDGVNTVFTLAGTPNPVSTLLVVLNGQVLARLTGYTISGNVITFTGATPPSSANNDTLRIYYQT